MFSSVRSAATSLAAAAAAATTIANNARRAVPEHVYFAKHMHLCVYYVCISYVTDSHIEDYTQTCTFACVYSEAAAAAPANRQAQRIDDCRRASLWCFCARVLAAAVSGLQSVHILCKVRERESPHRRTAQRSMCMYVVCARVCMRRSRRNVHEAACGRHAVREGVVLPAAR